MGYERERPDPAPEEREGGSVVHGGEGDPLGGGVAELEDDERVSEGVPEQETS